MAVSTTGNRATQSISHDDFVRSRRARLLPSPKVRLDRILVRFESAEPGKQDDRFVPGLNNVRRCQGVRQSCTHRLAWIDCPTRTYWLCSAPNSQRDGAGDQRHAPKLSHRRALPTTRSVLPRTRLGLFDRWSSAASETVASCLSSFISRTAATMRARSSSRSSRAWPVPGGGNRGPRIRTLNARSPAARPG